MNARLTEILLDSDLTLAAFLLGWGLILWGVIAIGIRPSDLLTFSGSMESGTPLFWALNYIGAGAGYVWVAYHRLPPLSSLLLGTYSCLVWTWIAGVRSAANYTSGVSLNILVISVGCLLIQRSARK